MRLALDTNRYRDLVDGDQDVRGVLERAAEIVVPFTVLAELRAGFAHGSRGRENERTLRAFLAQDGVRVVFATEATIALYADVYRQLRAAGKPIPTNDLWIAAVVLEHGLVLYTRDAHFEHIGQLHRV